MYSAFRTTCWRWSAHQQRKPQGEHAISHALRWQVRYKQHLVSRPEHLLAAISTQERHPTATYIGALSIADKLSIHVKVSLVPLTPCNTALCKQTADAAC